MDQTQTKIRILLIEDNPGDALLIKEQLREFSAEVAEPEIVQTLAEGLYALEKKEFDLVLLDLNLPDSQGMETFEAVYEANKYIAIIVLTGISSSELALKMVKKGAQDFLTKGIFDVETLYKSISMSIERNQLLKERILNQKALQVSEDRFKKLIDMSNSPILIIDKKNKVLYRNNAAKLIFMDQDALDKEVLLNTSNDGEETEVFLRNGKTVVLESSETDWENEKVFLIICHDITERKNLELLKAKLTRNFSHSLKTPLSNAVMLMDRAKLAFKEKNMDKLQEFCGLVCRNIQEAYDDVQRMMELLALESNKDVLQEDILLDEMVKSMVDKELSRSCGEREIDILIENNADRKTIFANRNEINMLVRNLINNAIKFTEKGRIRISLADSEDKLIITVEDSGCGIEKEKLDLIGEKFYQIDPSSQGIGIGLKICKEVAAKYKGSILVSSQGENRGTKVEAILEL